MYVKTRADIELMDVTISIDLGDTVKNNLNEVIEELETCHNCFIFKPKTLNEYSKLKWFGAAIDKYSLEEFEEKFSV